MPLRKIKPPLYAAAYLGLAFLLNRIPLNFPPFPIQHVTSGILIMISGFALMLKAFLLFKKRATAILPTDMPRSLVIEGPYRWTRNPMYVGISVMLFGAAVALGGWPYYGVPLLFAWTVNSLHIPMEEQNMEKVFGADYLRYKSKTRRWF